MGIRMDREEREQQVLLVLRTKRVPLGLTAIARGVGMSYSTHLKGIVRGLAERGYVHQYYYEHKTQIVMKWQINMGVIYEDNPELGEWLDRRSRWFNPVGQDTDGEIPF